MVQLSMCWTRSRWTWFPVPTLPLLTLEPQARDFIPVGLFSQLKSKDNKTYLIELREGVYDIFCGKTLNTMPGI